MPDIRLVRPRSSHVWISTGVLAAVALLIWSVSTFVVGDRTAPKQQPRVGAAANFGAERAPVLPMRAAAFATLLPLQESDLGRLVHLSGSAESRVVSNWIWVRSNTGARILVRFEPAPPEGTLARFHPGARVDVAGYVQKISRAEFNAWVDSLAIAIPRPPPGRKFGDLPSPDFIRLDSLFIKEYYLSVRPEGLTGREVAP
jgi:hypothetical protein